MPDGAVKDGARASASEGRRKRGSGERSMEGGRTMTRLHISIGILAGGALSLLSSLALGEELRIGGVGPLSGGGTEWGLSVQRGLQIAIDELNAAGGLKIAGKTYNPSLIMYDKG